MQFGVGSDGLPIYDVLEELVDNSLLRREQVDGGRVRYDLLESVREYSSAKLHDLDEVSQTRARHAAYFSQYADVDEKMRQPGGGTGWVEWIRELDNLVVGIEYGDPVTAPRCCLAALRVLSMRGPVSLGIEISERVLAMEGLSRRTTMRLELERSKYLRISGRMAEARATIGDVLSEKPPPSAPAPEPDSEHLPTQRLQNLGDIEFHESNLDAAGDMYRQALTLARVNKDRLGEVNALTGQGYVHQAKGQREAARVCFSQALNRACTASS